MGNRRSYRRGGSGKNTVGGKNAAGKGKMVLPCPHRKKPVRHACRQNDEAHVADVYRPWHSVISGSKRLQEEPFAAERAHLMNLAGGKLQGLPKALREKVEKIVHEAPASEEVFEAVIDHFQQQQQQDNPKRKKLESGVQHPLAPSAATISSLEGTNIMLQLPDLSIQSPLRKRLNLLFGAVKGEKKAYLALTKSLEAKPELLLRSLSPDNIKFAAILNVPEKKPLRYLLVDYIHNDGDVFKNDPLLIQFNNDQLEEQFGSILSGKTFVQYLTSQLSLIDFKVFDCTSHDETFSVQAYKGNREGYLYFLPNHVIFGFRKPIHIFNSTDIESITYNSITRLTFNVLLDVRIHGMVEKYEFSMIDQKEFENIDSYVKTKDVRDNSMADEHKAQKQLKNNTEAPSDLAEAAKLVPGGEQLIPSGGVPGVAQGQDDDEDDEDDDNYHIGDSDDDHSDNSGPEDNMEEEEANDKDGHNIGEQDDEDDEDDDNYDDNGEEGEDDDLVGHEDDYTTGFTPGSIVGLDSFGAFDENLQEELQDLQKDMNIDINELRKEGYIDM